MDSTLSTTPNLTSRATPEQTEECPGIEVDDNNLSHNTRRNQSKILDKFIKIGVDEYQCVLCQAQNPMHKVVIKRNKDKSTNVFWRHMKKAHCKVHDEIKGVSSNQIALHQYDFQSNKLLLQGINMEQMSHNRRHSRSKILDRFIEIGPDEYQCVLCETQNPTHRVVIRRNKDKSTNVFWRHLEKAHRKVLDDIKGVSSKHITLCQNDLPPNKLPLQGITMERMSLNRKCHRSKILDKFIEIGLNEYQCALCQVQNPTRRVVIKRNKDKSTNVFWRHIEKAHRKVLDDIKGVSSKQTTLLQYNFQSNKLYLQGITIEQTKEEFVRFICDNYLPWRYVKKKSFRRLWFYARQVMEDVPGPSAVKTTAERMYRQVQGKLVGMFVNIQSVSLTMYAWTSKNDIPLLGVMVHWVDTEWKLHELLIGLRQIKGPHNDANMAKIIIELVYEYGIESKLSSITTGNVSNNITMLAAIVDSLKIVNPNFTLERCIPCVAHVLYLVVQAGLNVIYNRRTSGSDVLQEETIDTLIDDNQPLYLPMDASTTSKLAPLRDVVTQVRAIIIAIQGSTQHTKKYIDLCNKFEMPNSNKIQVDNSMHWNSTLDMLEGALAKRKVLDNMALHFISTLSKDYNICKTDWDMLDEYASIFRPLRNNLKLVCTTKKLSITKVTTLVTALTSHLAYTMQNSGELLPSEQRDALRTACGAMHAKLVYYTSLLWRNQAFASATILDPFSELKAVDPSSHQHVLSFISNLLEFTSPSDTSNNESMHGQSSQGLRPPHYITSKIQLIQPSHYQQSCSTPKQELEKYLNISCSEQNDTPLGWWKEVGTQYFPRLSKIALEYLAVSPTSASVKQLFSIGRGIATYQRSRLKVESIEMLMVLRAWFHHHDQYSSDSDDEANDDDSVRVD